MISLTRITRVILIAATALAVAVPAASAKPLVSLPTPAASSGQGYQGTYRPVTDQITMAPDVQDRVGTDRQVTGIHPLPVATTITVSNTSFDWTAAAIGAASVGALGLVGAGILGFRGRRRMALGV